MEILFVCTGNTCRSPLAQVLMQRNLIQRGVSGIHVSSAGIAATPGQPASSGIRGVLKPPEDLSDHGARQIDENLVVQADLILTMTASHKALLAERYPAWSSKIHTLGEYAWNQDVDIADPYGGGRDEYMLARNEIERALDKLAGKLAEQVKEVPGLMKVALASDHGGFRLKEELKEFISGMGHQYKDYGCPSEESVDYPDLAAGAARAVAHGECDLGIIVCGTGQGMAIAANKIKGIRAANCHDCYSAKMARAHNNANILTLGQRVVGSELAKMIAETFLATSFEGQRHQRRLDKIAAMEEDFHR